jgi:hypothetical protein
VLTKSARTVSRSVHRPGFEPDISWLQVRRAATRANFSEGRNSERKYVKHKQRSKEYGKETKEYSHHFQGWAKGGVRYDSNTHFALRPRTPLQFLLPRSCLIKFSLSVSQPLGDEDTILPRATNNVSRLMELNKAPYKRLLC